jgi:hypothetical protein
MASAPHPSISPAQHQSGAASKFTILLKPLPLGLLTFLPPAPQTYAIVGKKGPFFSHQAMTGITNGSSSRLPPCANALSPTRHQLSATGQDDDAGPLPAPESLPSSSIQSLFR